MYTVQTAIHSLVYSQSAVCLRFYLLLSCKYQVLQLVVIYSCSIVKNANNEHCLLCIYNIHVLLPYLQDRPCEPVHLLSPLLKADTVNTFYFVINTSLHLFFEYDSTISACFIKHSDYVVYSQPSILV